MYVASQVKKFVASAVTIDNQIRPIKWLVMPEWDGDKLEFGAMRNIRKSANPSGIKLARG
jgi:hypothetical protein